MSQRSFLILVFVAVAAHLLDATVTAIGIWRGAQEANPFQVAIYNSSGLFGMAVLKLILVSLVIVLLWRMRRECRPWQVAIAALCLIVPALAVSVLNALTITGT